ncbi:MAG TPA: hypothetical protein VFT55_04335, partial [Planctomycetota bacterium]|nr:hypothetical protein [Planctomycetota bacterium]
CDSVHVHDGSFGHPTNLSASTVVFTDSWFSVPPALSSAIIQQGGRTQLVGCHVLGLSFPAQFSARAIDLNGGEVRALGGGEIVSHAFYGPPSYAVTGTGTLRLDPSVTVYGASPPIAPGIAVTVEAMPHVTATDALLGSTSTSTSTVTLPGPSGHLGLLAVGFAGPPVLVPLFADPLFWAPGTVVALTAGVMGPGQPITSQVLVPAHPAFAGLLLLYQGITLEPLASLQISNPAIGVVR